MTAATFPNVLASLAQDGDQFHVEPSEDWRQGRTLFGGLSACLAVRSAQRAFPQLPPLRSAQFAFIGPVTGALFLKPILLRAGKSATFIQVAGKTETNAALSATLVLGVARRSGQSYSALPMPDVASPGALPELIREPFAPTFSYQFETQIAGGAPAASGAAKPEFLAWLRHRDHSAPDDITSIIALGDATPPPALSMLPADFDDDLVNRSFERQVPRIRIAPRTRRIGHDCRWLLQPALGALGGFRRPHLRLQANGGDFRVTHPMAAISPATSRSGVTLAPGGRRH
jgi:hypothetical protein